MLLCLRSHMHTAHYVKYFYFKTEIKPRLTRTCHAKQWPTPPSYLELQSGYVAYISDYVTKPGLKTTLFLNHQKWFDKNSEMLGGTQKGRQARSLLTKSSMLSLPTGNWWSYASLYFRESWSLYWPELCCVLLEKLCYRSFESLETGQ